MEKKIYLLRAPDNTRAPYVEYEILEEEGSMYAENEEIQTRYNIQIDIFTDGNYVEIAKKIKQVMQEQGFTKTYGGSKYEEETKLFHYILRFNYESEV